MGLGRIERGAKPLVKVDPRLPAAWCRDVEDACRITFAGCAALEQCKIDLNGLNYVDARSGFRAELNLGIRVSRPVRSTSRSPAVS